MSEGCLWYFGERAGKQAALREWRRLARLKESMLSGERCGSEHAIASWAPLLSQGSGRNEPSTPMMRAEADQYEVRRSLVS